MKLTKLINKSKIYEFEGELADFEVKGVTANSKEVKPGFIFVAIKGVNSDGNNFIAQALQNGAQTIVIQKNSLVTLDLENVNLIKVSDCRKAIAELAKEFYQDPSSKIKVVGVTGTNGKTTITYLIEAILNECGKIPAVLGTVNYRFKDNIFDSKNTTPGPDQLQAMLADMLKQGVDYLTMEVSSHALDQQRTKGVNFTAAIFTNLTQDHLDYHKTLADYFSAKAKLFQELENTAYSIINIDDTYGQKLINLSKGKIITYAIDSPAQVIAKNIKYSASGTEFILINKEKEFSLKISLIGKHNVYNVLAAVAWAMAEGVEIDIICRAIEGFSFVPGRLQRCDVKKEFSVFVDYAHTDDALKNVITSLREFSEGKIIVVFGCGGDRDKTKRPKMGRVVTELADLAIITSDNPRSEEPKDIINDIKKGINKDNFLVELDRKSAIKKSLSMAKKGDIVLIAGKGHEKTQILKDKVLEFDDCRMAEECLI